MWARLPGNGCDPLDAGGRRPTAAAASSPALLVRRVALALPRDQPAARAPAAAPRTRPAPPAAPAPGPARRRRLPRLAARPVLRPRVHDPHAVAAPAAAPRRSMNSHLRRPDSTRSNATPGRAIASGRPGNPAPLPMSATRARPHGQRTARAAREAVRDVHERRPRPDRVRRWPRADRRARAPAGVESRSCASASSDQSRATAARRAAAAPSSAPRFTFYALAGGRRGAAA